VALMGGAASVMRASASSWCISLDAPRESAVLACGILELASAGGLVPLEGFGKKPDFGLSTFGNI
jgi:hypothetical protein